MVETTNQDLICTYLCFHVDPIGLPTVAGPGGGV